MEDTENTTVSMLLDEAMEQSELPAQDTKTTDEGNGDFISDGLVNATSGASDENDQVGDHLAENEEEDATALDHDNNLPEGVMEVNAEGFVGGMQGENTTEGLMEAHQTDVEMMDEDVDGAHDTQVAGQEGIGEPMEIPDGPVSTSEEAFSDDHFVSQTSALIVQNEPPQQLMEEADTPGEEQLGSDAIDVPESKEAVETQAREPDEALFGYVDEGSSEAVQEHQEEGILLHEGEDADQDAVPDAQETLAEQDGINQHNTSDELNKEAGATPEDQPQPTAEDLPEESLAVSASDTMELPLEDGVAGASEGAEGYILAGSQLEGSLGGLEGKIFVGADGNVHLLTGQESLQGIQLMEGDDKPEDNAEDAEAQMQQAIRAQLQEALLKQEEIKQEEEERGPEEAPPPDDQSNADALATLASAALDHQAPPANGLKSEPETPEVKPESNEPQWMDVGICKGTHCVVRSFYIPSEGQSWDRNWEGINTTTLPDHRSLAKLELEAGKAYKFRVAAINSCGRGPWSEISAFRTSMPGVPGAPSAIKISKTSEGAHLSWEPPSASSGVIEDYTVYMAVRSATTDSQVVSSGANQLAFVRIYSGVENQCSVGFETLNEAHIDTTTKPAILFRIAARNEKGLGPAIQVRWLQDGTIPTNAKPINAARRVGGDLKPHGSIKRKKSECE